MPGAAAATCAGFRDGSSRGISPRWARISFCAGIGSSSIRGMRGARGSRSACGGMNAAGSSISCALPARRRIDEQRGLRRQRADRDVLDRRGDRRLGGRFDRGIHRRGSRDRHGAAAAIAAGATTAGGATGRTGSNRSRSLRSAARWFSARMRCATSAMRSLRRTARAAPGPGRCRSPRPKRGSCRRGSRRRWRRR